MEKPFDSKNRMEMGNMSKRQQPNNSAETTIINESIIRFLNELGYMCVSQKSSKYILFLFQYSLPEHNSSETLTFAGL